MLCLLLLYLLFSALIWRIRECYCKLLYFQQWSNNSKRCRYFKNSKLSTLNLESVFYIPAASSRYQPCITQRQALSRELGILCMDVEVSWSYVEKKIFSAHSSVQTLNASTQHCYKTWTHTRPPDVIMEKPASPQPPVPTHSKLSHRI